MKIKQDWIAPLMSCTETVFIIDDRTKQIVWSNDPPTVGYCYEAFFGRTDMCPFCPKLTENELYTWDYYDKHSDRWLKIKNVLFRDGERLLRAGNFNRMDDAMSLSHDSVKEISFLQNLLRENRRMKDTLEREATHDRMTGLYNRNRFNFDISSGMYDAANTGVLFFDLNNLKEVNDTYRHETGDRLICRLADAVRQLSGEFCPSESYRIGGDEFIMMLTGCSKETTEQALVRFRDILREAGTESPPCAVAVGSSFSCEPCDAERLISDADKAMYVCKKQMKSGSLICRTKD